MNAKKLAKLNTISFKCIDGPLKGQLLRLSIDGETFVFTINGQTGHYIGGKWHGLS